MVLSKSFLHNRKVALLLLLVLILGAVAFILLYVKSAKNPLTNVPLFQKGPKVSIKSEYTNPFDKKSQYVNPFETYKNPFVVSK